MAHTTCVMLFQNASELLCDAQTLEPTGGHRDHKVTTVLWRTVYGPNLIGGRSGQWLLITAAIPGQMDWPRRETGRAKQTEYLSRLTRHGLGRLVILLLTGKAGDNDEFLDLADLLRQTGTQNGRRQCSNGTTDPEIWPVGG